MRDGSASRPHSHLTIAGRRGSAGWTTTHSVRDASSSARDSRS